MQSQPCRGQGDYVEHYLIARHSIENPYLYKGILNPPL